MSNPLEQLTKEDLLTIIREGRLTALAAGQGLSKADKKKLFHSLSKVINMTDYRKPIDRIFSVVVVLFISLVIQILNKIDTSGAVHVVCFVIFVAMLFYFLLNTITKLTMVNAKLESLIALLSKSNVINN